MFKYLGRTYPIACFSGLSITDKLITEYVSEDTYYRGTSKFAASNCDGVPNDRPLVLPLRVGSWKNEQDFPDDTLVEVCRGCGAGIYLGHVQAVFYQGDIRFSMGHKLCLALIAYDVLKNRRDRTD